MKYLLLVQFSNGCESYFGDDADKLKEYAELRKFDYWTIYELNKEVYSYVNSREKVI